MTMNSQLIPWIQSRINEGNDNTLSIGPLKLTQWCSLYQCFIKDQLPTQNNVLVFADPQHYFQAQEILSQHDDILFLPAIEESCYSQGLANHHFINDLLYQLSLITYFNQKKKRYSIACLANNLISFLPPVSFVQEYSFVVELNQTLSISELESLLIKLAFRRTGHVKEIGDFSIRGEIVDIFVADQQIYRLNYFDDDIESIYRVNRETGISEKNKQIDYLVLSPQSRIFFDSHYKNLLRQNIPQVATQFKKLHHDRNLLFENLEEEIFFDNAHLCLPLFFDEKSLIRDFLTNCPLYFFYQIENCLSSTNHFYQTCQQQYQELSPSLLPGPDFFFEANIFNNFNLNKINVTHLPLVNVDKNSFSIELNPLKNYLQAYGISGKSLLQSFIGHLDQLPADKKIIIFGDEKLTEEIKNQLLAANCQCSIETSPYSLDDSYFYGDTFFLNSSTLLRKSNPKKILKGKHELFANQIASLKDGDLVIHTLHGIGSYQGVKKLSLGNQESDYLVLSYKDDDKVYVPLYKLNLIQKYSSPQEGVALDDLKSKKFENSKSKAKQHIRKLAIDLIRLQAERLSQETQPFSAPGDDYLRFENDFPYNETPDQKQSIEDVLSDLMGPKPMDRLICGDVGFGKTEIAMRAAFKCVEDNRQVIVLVPTTILCMQHYNSFKERFKNFPIKIAQMSRLVSTKETNHMISEIKEGKIDIIIGTHKLLNDKIVYRDLGLIIVDEEHRFGVAHKEKLKLLKSNVDFLTLTATPIPRTLQLSFSGLKDLSLIQTPPKKRLAVKNFIIREDISTITTAIENEISRGGQVFYVHNKVQDIEIEMQKIQKLVPKAKITFAHGQMSAKELEKKICDFYDKKFDILLATTIIESGIDIPSANTMIIHDAQNFGLAQLHQLRGRIGRSDQRAYCYFVIPKTTIGDIAQKRLKALQQYCELGAGFLIASADLDIRGSGDLIGAEQSGHLKSIGVELYFNLLEEAVNELKGQKESLGHWDFDFNSYFPCHIPSTYIEDPPTRLKYYKKVSSAWLKEDLELVQQEIIDQFGPLPAPFVHLVDIFKVRNILRQVGVKRINVKQNSLSLQFNESFLNDHPQVRDKLVQYFLTHPNKYKVEPKYLIKVLNYPVANSEKLVNFCLDFINIFKSL